MHSRALAVTLAILPVVALAAQRTPGAKPRAAAVTEAFTAMRAAEWETAVRTHAPGTLDEPLETIASWPAGHVTAVVRLVIERLHRLLEIPGGVNAQELAALTGVVVRGLSLHTDIALAERETRSQRSPEGAQAAVVLVDGRETRYVGRSAHWPIERPDPWLDCLNRHDPDAETLLAAWVAGVK